MARLNRVESFRGTSKTEDGCLTCGKCREKICKGDSYLWWANRLPGQRSSFRNIRCTKRECFPRESERTPGRRGELLGIQEGVDDSLQALEGFDTIEELEAISQEAAEDMRALAQEIQEAADNMEDGFGVATSRSEELRERGEELESFADELESVNLEDPPEREDFDSDEDYEDALGSWREDMVAVVSDAAWDAEV